MVEVLLGQKDEVYSRLPPLRADLNFDRIMMIKEGGDLRLFNHTWAHPDKPDRLGTFLAPPPRPADEQGDCSWP